MDSTLLLLTFSPIAFTIPFFHLEIRWYGILFATGFYLAYLLLARLLNAPKIYSEKLLFYIFIGVIVGARLGHVLFYDPEYYLQNPLEIIAIWHGGLASHGGAIGLLTALFLFTRRHKDYTFLQLLDKLAIVAPLLGAFIRVGNFLNQEILGTKTALPWGVIFCNPLDPLSSSHTPLHPVQLYEALLYFTLFLTLYFSRNKKWTPGTQSGLLLSILFSGRFLLEYVKEVPGAFDYAGNYTNFSIGQLSTGQLLSLPFVGVGLYLMLTGRSRKR